MSNSKKIMIGAGACLGLVALVGGGYLMGVNSSKQTTGAVQRVSYPGEWNQSHGMRGFHNPHLISGWGAYDPFQEMARIQEAMNQMLADPIVTSSTSKLPFFSKNSLSAYQPSLDMQEQTDAYLIQLDIPGIQKNEVDIKVHEHVIVVSGQRTTENQSTDDDRGYFRFERSSGAFMRTIPLPEDASRSGIEANMERGVLTIKIPKKEALNQKGSLSVPVK